MLLKLFITRRLAIKASPKPIGRLPPSARDDALRSTETTRFGLPSSVLTALALGGCATRGAPSYTLFGAYFPAWMFCAGIGLAAAVVARAFFEATGLAYVLPFQLFVCASIGVCAASLRP